MAFALCVAISCSNDDDTNNNEQQQESGQSFTAEEFATLTPETLPDYDTWSVTGDVTMTQTQFETMMSGIEEALGDREITLIFEDETSLDFMVPYTFSDGMPVTLLLDNFVSLSAPKVTSLDDYTFACCYYIKSFDLPEVTSMGELAFYRCYSLVSFNMPKVKNLSHFGFLQPASLVIAEFPSVTSIEGEYIFRYATNLIILKLTSPDEITIESSLALYQCTNIANCTLYLHHNNSVLATSDKLKNLYDGSTFGRVIYVNDDGDVTDADGNVL
ncbi:MAG: leucine-rich repeat protein [Rikenellaceae bacterium]